MSRLQDVSKAVLNSVHVQGKNNDSVSRTSELLGELLGEPKQQQQEQQQQQKQEPPSEAVAEVYRAAAAAAASPPAAADEPASGRSNPAIAGADANLQVSLHTSRAVCIRQCQQVCSSS
jgi:hypothetical protein